MMMTLITMMMMIAMALMTMMMMLAMTMMAVVVCPLSMDTPSLGISACRTE